MLHSAMPFDKTDYSPRVQTGGENRNLIAILMAMFSWSKDSPIKSNEVESENSFSDYLDGYFNSFDFYPVCTRHLYSQNDAYALWMDFVKVAEDHSTQTKKMLVSPEKFMSLGTMSGEELEIRKRKAATEAVKKAIGKI